jgi:hypothetical protein
MLTDSCAGVVACRDCELLGRECELLRRRLDAGREGGGGAGSTITARIRRRACSRSWTHLASRVKVLLR